MLSDRDDILARIADTDVNIAQLRANRDFHSYLLMENSLMLAAIDFDVQSLIDQRVSRDTSENARAAEPFGVDRATSIAGGVLARQATNLKVRGDALMHHIKTLNASGLVTLQRRMALVQELNQLVNEMHQWRADNLKVVSTLLAAC